MDEADVAVIGGSFAGASAALHVARGQRRVLILDHGLTRNRFARASHGFLGQDGASPRAIRAIGLAEALSYPGARLVEAEVTELRADGDGFELGWEGGRAHASRIVLATGMRDLLPAVPGLAACWGLTANQCPYCHGHELAGRPTAIWMTGPGSLHQARLLTEWASDLVLLLDGHEIAPSERDELRARGLRLVEGPVERLEEEGGELRAIVAGGRRIERGALYLAPRFEPASPLGPTIGCATAEGPMGRHLVVDALGRTSVAGVLAAGDLTRPFYNATLSAAEGVRAGTAAHQSLVPGLQ